VSTFKAYQWQSRRKLEKIEEMKLRYKRLSSEPYNIGDSGPLPWVNVDEHVFKQEWEFMPVEICGNLEKNRVAYIQRTKDNEPGYHLINVLRTNDGQEILIDRGWVPIDWKEISSHFETKNNEQVCVKGIIYKGDKLNKYSQGKVESNTNTLLTMDPMTLANILNIADQNTSGQFIIKQVSQGDRDKLYPVAIKPNDLMVWTITPETHQSYSNFWLFVTIMNMCSNVYIWAL
jgi:cytochrome oxidase assembly protein ShyY1